MRFAEYYVQDGDSLQGIKVRAESGAVYLLQEISIEEHLPAIDGNVVAFNDRIFAANSVFVRHERKIYRVQSMHQPGSGMFGGWPDTDKFSQEGYEKLIGIPWSVYVTGVEPNPDIGPNSPRLRMRDEGVFAVPGQCRVENSDLVELFFCHGKRFARLTSLGLEQEEARHEAEQAAERERRAAEAAAAAKQREQEQLAAAEAERREAEEQEAEEQRQAASWLNAWQEPFKPGALVMDMCEATPRVGRFDVEGVYPSQDGTFSYSPPAIRLPRHGTVVFNSPPRFPHQERKEDWEENDSWDQRGVSIHHEAYKNFLAYRGPSVPVGSRISRDLALDGRKDPCPPTHGNVEFVRLEIIGNEYNSRAGNLFTVADAKDYLEKKHPTRVVNMPRTEDAEDDDFESSHTYTESEEHTMEERYPHLYRGIFNGWDDEWDDYPWQAADRRALRKENERRELGNLAWMKRRALFHVLMALANGREFKRPAEFYYGLSFGTEALIFDLAIEGIQLDRLVKEIRKSDCQVLVHDVKADQRDILAGGHTSPLAEIWNEIWDCWDASHGSVDLFVSYTHSLRGKKIEWVIRGALARRTVCVFVGPAGLGKSTIAYEIAARVAAAQPFAGLETSGGQAAFVYGEDSQDFISVRRQAAASVTELAGRKLIEIDAGNFGRSISDILEFIRSKVGPCGLLVIDTIGSLVPDTVSGAGIRDAINLIKDFCEETGAGAILVHHTNKDLPPWKARDAKTVLDKTKGTGEFINAAREVWTLHLESPHKDQKKALDEGIRHITLVKDNIPVGVPKLQNSLALKMDLSTHLSENLQQPIVGVMQTAQLDAAGSGQQPLKKAAARSAASEGRDADAHEIARVIARIQSDGNGPVPITGLKSPYKLRRLEELVDWPRARCEAAHKRAIELGLVST